MYDRIKVKCKIGGSVSFSKGAVFVIQKGKSGILQSMESRAAFLHDPTHTMVLYSTPKHASWMNQGEIWRSHLVRKLLKRGNFPSHDDLREQILAFIAYYDRTMAKPIKWTYTGLT